MQESKRLAGSAGAIALAFALTSTAASADWTRRMGDAQNTGNAGDIEALTSESVRDLALAAVYPVGSGRSTPVASGDLAVFQAGGLHVIDLAAERVLVSYTGDVLSGINNATPVIGTVTLSDGTEEERVYIIGHCLNLTAIRADRATIENDPGTSYTCAGSGWPLASSHGTVTPVFSPDQTIIVDGKEETRDVLFQQAMAVPTGVSPGALGYFLGQIWAVDAVTGETLWIWSPPNPLVPSHSWFSLSMNRERTAVYLTTANLSWEHVAANASIVTGNLNGGRAESTIAIDAHTGGEHWFHQRRIYDQSDLDTGNGATVVDVEGEDGCHLVVGPDKDGCLYAYEQAPDIPEVGDADYDRLRPGQQRTRWRQCFKPADTTQAFNLMTASFDGRRVFAQGGTSRAAGDDVNAFAVDACTGEVVWTSSSVSAGSNDGALASGMLFQKDAEKIQILRAEDGTDLATVPLQQGGDGHGGIAILPDGRILAPSHGGLAVFAVDPGSNASAPVSNGSNSFAGPYPEPFGELNRGYAMEAPLRAVLEGAGQDLPGS